MLLVVSINIVFEHFCIEQNERTYADFLTATETCAKIKQIAV